MSPGEALHALKTQPAKGRRLIDDLPLFAPAQPASAPPTDAAPTVLVQALASASFR